MGTEVAGNVHVGGTKALVNADFGSDHVTFHGGRRGQVPYRDIEVVGTAKGVLKIRVDGALMEFKLGDKVDRIANKIRRPPSTLDKLGVKPGMAVAVAGDFQRPFLEMLRAAIPDLAEDEPPGPVDLLFFGPSSSSELDALGELRNYLRPEGGLWVVFPKGSLEMRDRDVIAGGREAGLKDVKVVRVSESHTALKFVIPFAERET
jgi:hypothetical protein